MLTSLLLSAVLPPPVHFTMTQDVRRYDFAGTKSRGAMYMPTMVKLEDGLAQAKGAGLPSSGVFKWGEVSLGNGISSKRALALDTTSNRLFADANGNGDWGDDLPVQIERIASNTGVNSYQTTVLFDATYQSGARHWTRPYAINFYWREGATQLACFRATAWTASRLVGGKRVVVELTESNNQGVFHERFDQVADPSKLRPVTLLLNGTRVDPRGSFQWDGVEYLAEIAPDGSEVTLRPTGKSVKPPPPAPEKPSDLLKPGTIAPDFQVEAAKGGTVKLSDFRGKIVILKFWATWCGPCIASMPHFEEVYKQVVNQEVALLAVCVADDRKPFDQFVAANASKFTYPFFFDPSGREDGIQRRLFNVTGIPTVYVIGRDGKIVGSIVGYSDGDRRLEEMLRPLGLKISD